MKTIQWGAAVALACTLTTVDAQEIEFNGFLSAVGGLTTEEDTEYAGYDDEAGFDPDSVLGLQVNATISDRLRAVAQVLARGDDDFDAELEWAYLAYDVSDRFTFRAGRLRAPFYQYSDFLDVSYAYPWIRPPEEVYSIVNITGFQGIDLLYNWNTGNWSNEIQAYYGAEDGEVAVNGARAQQEVNDFAGLAVETGNNLLTFRASVHQGEVTAIVPDIEPLFDTLRQVGFGSVADRLEVRDKDARFYGLFGGYDDGRFFGQVEWTRLDWQDDSFFSPVDAWYATAGARTGAFTYHLTYSVADQEPDADFSAPIPGGVSPQLDVLKATVDSLPLRADDQAITAGVRWDFTSNLAFKLEYSDVSRDVPGDLDTGLVSFGFDMVF